MNHSIHTPNYTAYCITLLLLAHFLPTTAASTVAKRNNRRSKTMAEHQQAIRRPRAAQQAPVPVTELEQTQKECAADLEKYFKDCEANPLPIWPTALKKALIREGKDSICATYRSRPRFYPPHFYKNMDEFVRNHLNAMVNHHGLHALLIQSQKDLYTLCPEDDHPLIARDFAWLRLRIAYTMIHTNNCFQDNSIYAGKAIKEALKVSASVARVKTIFFSNKAIARDIWLTAIPEPHKSDWTRFIADYANYVARQRYL
ncbi:MAG TPA: hypothetical protein VLG71_03030 [Candidatus Limnocylindria bacterium]|nr:hypothetical protein [Candidatus Limnocylindria bacterium]